MLILAKSFDQGGLTLIEHTQHVIQAILPMANAYGLDADLAKQGAILHDLGKAHPAFQAMLYNTLSPEQTDQYHQGNPIADLVKDFAFKQRAGTLPPHRHEYSSLLLLPWFEEKSWPVLIEQVLAHHKSITGHSRSFSDLIEREGENKVFKWHCTPWIEWQKCAAFAANHFGVDCPEISLEHAKVVFEYLVDYLDNIENRVSIWKGLLVSADHLASCYQNDLVDVLPKLYQKPNLETFARRSASPKAHLYPLSNIDLKLDYDHTLVVAPTGAGKTDFLIRRCKQRIFYTLPFQASINAMYVRFMSDLPGQDVRRQHAASRIPLAGQSEDLDLTDDNLEDADLQMHPGSAIKVMTPHQLASIALGTKRHEAMALDVRGQDIILDEVHTYSKGSQWMVLKIIEALVQLDCRIHIGTATIPTVLKEAILNRLNKGKIYEVRLPPAKLETFNRHVIYQINQDDYNEVLLQGINEGKKVIVVSNRVQIAQKRYNDFTSTDLGTSIPSMLIHSRFKRRDRKSLEQKIYEFQDYEGSVVLFATQVVEVSLDISYDLMITDAAPIDSLIQRFGRINRKRTEDTIGNYKPIYIVQPEEGESTLPYEKETIDRTLNVLPDNGALFKETEAQKMIDKVYPEMLEPIPQHFFIYTEAGVCTLERLKHKNKSVLIELLEIDGSTLIRKSDEQQYLRAKSEERIELEIPATRGVRFSIQKNDDVYQLDRGSRPFVIPDEWYKSDIGFEMTEIEAEVNTII